MAEQTSRLAIIIDSTGAEKNASSLSSALHGLTEWGQKAAASAGKVTKATQEEKSALQDLLDRIDPVNAALNKLDKQQQELSRAKSKGLLDADSFEDYAAKIDDARNRVSGLTGENEKLQASFSQIRSQLDPLGAALERLKSQRATLSAARDAGFLSPEYHAELSGRLNETERGLTAVNNEMKFGSISASQYKNAMRMLPMQINDIATSIAGGMPLFTIFMQQGSQIADSFGGWTSLIDIIKQQVLGLGSASEDAGDSLSDTANGLSENADNAQRLTGLLTPTRLAIGGVTAVLGTLAYAWYKGSQEQDNFNESLILTGNIAGKTSGQLADIAKSVASSTGNTISSAAEALNRAVSGGKIASASLEKVTEAVVSMNDATGAAVDDLVNDFEKIAQNPVAAISDLNNRYHFLTLATYEQIKALQDEGNQQEAARVATDSYSAAVKQRSGEIKDNLGTLQTAWNAVADAAKWAWDSMLDIGREVSIDQKILDASSELERAQKSLSDLQKGAANSAGPYGAWKSDDIDRQQKSVTILKNRLSSLRSEKIAQDVLNDSFNSYIQRQQEGIKLQQETSSFQSKYLTRQQQMAKELEELNKLKARGAKLDFEALEAQIRDRFKDPEPKKQKAYTEDAATRLLDQINQQTAAMQSQLDASDKLNSATQARVKFEQQIADLKSKTQLTADQQSILARSQEILQAYKNQEALQNSVKTLDDYQKMQEEIAPKELRQNEILQERLEILQKMVALKKLTPEAAGQQASDLISRSVLPDSVISGVNKAGGTLRSGATNSDLSGQGLNMIGLQIDPQLEIIDNLKQAQMDYATWLNQQQQAITQSTVLNEKQKQDQLLALQQQGQQNQQALSTAVYVAQAQSAQNSFASITNSMGVMFGEQSAMYKAAFVTQKAFAIAQAALQLPMAMGQALAGLPFPANLAAIAQVVGLMSTITSSITSVAATGFMSGGYTGNGATRSISGVVHGQEYVFDAAATKRIGVSNLEAIRNGGLDATLSKPGFGTGNKNASSSGSGSQTNHINQVINMPQSPGMTQQEMDAVLKLNNKQLVNELSNQTLEGKGQFGKSLRAAQGRGNRMT